MYACVERTKVENYIYIISQKTSNCDEKPYFSDETGISPDKMQCQNYQTERYGVFGTLRGRCEKLAKIGGKDVLGAVMGGAALDRTNVGAKA